MFNFSNALRISALTKLRTILLLEADFNMNNKVLGSDAMRSGERIKELAPDNYGGRRGLRVAEISMNQLLTYNSIWGRRGRAILMSNDAKGCYDRIAHIVVDLALQRLGAPGPALQSMIETIQDMTHHIRTAYGDSDSGYKKARTIFHLKVFSKEMELVQLDGLALPPSSSMI